MATVSTEGIDEMVRAVKANATWPHVLKIQAASGQHLHQHWWQWVLISVILVSVAAGSLSILYSLCKKLLSLFRKKAEPASDLVANVAFHLQKYAGSQSELSLEKYEKSKPGSLGIYLGPFQSPATGIETKSWAKRDVVILDPFEENAVITVTSLSDSYLKPRQIVGRIDLAILLRLPPPTRHLEPYCISSVDQILSVILTRFRSLNGSSNGFTGVLFAGWDVFPVPILLELSHIITTLNLNVYLEASAPDFLSDSKVLASESITGLVVRNGLILPNGERRDCFDMEKFRPTVKAFVSQACLRDFTVLMWETLDEDVLPTNAVLKRTYKWCNFYSAVPWVGSSSALFDDSLDVVEVEPLSAFDWLKEANVVELHEMWRNKRILQLPNTKSSTNYPLNLLLPSLEAAQTPSGCDHKTPPSSSDVASPSEPPNWFILKEALGDPFCLSSSGKCYDGIGCFPLGVDVTLDDFHEIVWSQRNLKKLDLLDTIQPAALREYGSIFRRYVSETPEVDLAWKQDILELADTFVESNSDGSEGIRVFLSLHSGFQRNSDKQFWAVYHVHASGVTDLYISKNVQDVTGTLLHTFLSCRGFSRRQCLTAEFDFARWGNTLVAPHDISQRVSQDLSLLSPEECLILLQRIALAPEAGEDNLTRRIKSAVMERLIELPSVSQLKALNTAGYLEESINIEDLVGSQLRWHCHSNRPHPDLAEAVNLFREVEANIALTLKTRNRHNLDMITSTLDNLLRVSVVSATDDILALSVFCTMRKFAFEEVYIEVTDRNPLFNDQSDQSAAFAELFALGSRCEAYFDVSPSRFGELLSKRYRDHYSQSSYQPPLKEENTLALSSAYAEAQIDVDPDYKESEMPAYQRFTFLSVFAIPALIDILMLTTTGHGLYLSSSPDFMTQVEVHSATVALMLSLLLSGAIGTWITCGGTYYLASMAFSAMNYFVITRLLGGFAFTLVVGLVGFIVFCCTSGFHAGIVFFLYLIALTTYLVLLAALANYQFNGTAFQSGRIIIILCIPVLFVSPLVTIFGTNKDVIVYLTVLYVFVTLLLIGVRWIGSRWATWHQKLTLLEDSELREWYFNRVATECRDELDEKTDPALLKLARQCLVRDVVQETRKQFWAKPTTDALVLRMARSYDATGFLMDWYCRYSGVPKPMIFSSAWNVQTKVALESLQRSQLGIRFHNGFIHWRQAGDEIGCTMLYFIVALLDKWVSLIDGGSLTGLTSSDKNLRMPVGFGLAYYLVGAVLLDFNAHRLFELASKSKEVTVPTDVDIHSAALVKSHNRKKLYWVTLGKYLLWHVWGLAGTTTLVWVFASKDAVKPTIIFMSYVLAYTGLLWYQYTKVFSGPHALKPMLIGVSIGLSLGFILHHEFPHFVYTDIIALGVTTWTVAILSLWAGKIIGTPDDKPLSSIKGEFRGYSGSGPEKGWSQPELQSLHDTLSKLPHGERLVVDPKSDFGNQVKLILERCRYSKLPELASRAFPEAQKLLELTSKLFEEHTVTVKLVSVDHFTKYDKAMRAVSHVVKDKVQLFVGCETKYISRNHDPLPGFYQDVGELLIQAIAETFLGFTSRDAVLAQHLWMTNGVWGENATTPSFLERQLRLTSKSDSASSITTALKRQLTRDLCLGFDCDLDWEHLPEDIRHYLVNRSVGLPYELTGEQKVFLKEKLHISKGLDFETYLARCDYAAFTGALSLSRANAWISGDQSHKAHHSGDAKFAISVVDLLGSIAPLVKPSFYDKVLKYCGFCYHRAGIFFKFFAVAFAADPEYQREVNWTFSDKSKVIQRLSTAIFIGIWMWAKSFQRLLLPVFMFYRRANVIALWKNIQGMEVSIKGKRITVRNLDGVYTGFIHPVDEETFKLLQYWGDHKTEPPNGNGLCSTNMYSNNMALLRRVELSGDGSMTNDYVYEYRTADPNQPKRISKSDLLTSPIMRKGIAGRDALQDVNYNSKGQIDSGSYLKDGNLIRFQYHYQKSSRAEGALLRAEFVLPHMSCTVSWCAPPRRRPEKLDNWIPHSQVTEATFVIGPDVWESKYFYDHKFHPTILTTLNGQRVETPPLILYDHLDVLKKPKHVSFLHDNPLFSFTSTRSYPITRWLGVHTRRYPVSTSQARSWLWKAWKEDPGFDGVIVRWLDERLLRRDSMLRPYWRKRDLGNLEAAEEYLDENRDAVMASVDLDSTISSWTPLAMKMNDLYSFGQGGDACSRTRSNVTSQEEDNETALHVIAVDTGTWPNEGGGVSACRSDVINNLRTIKWHMVAESANDFGIPKRQIERNVHSLKVIPLWGLDLMTPTHGLFANRLDSEVEHINTHATLQDIEQSFVPILAALISGARSLDFSVTDVKQVTRALVNLNGYFNNMRHWSAVWGSDVVKNAWRRLWLSQIAANSRPSSEWFKAELPTLGQLDQGLELWSRYLFIFSIPIPDKMPAVFQASHHSVSASYGIVCKIKRGCTLQIWDHAISWRETNLYLSSALCALSPFTRNSLLGLMRMTSVLTLHHADTILPCADFFNPNWEVEIGTCQGKIQHRAVFKRKIDPVVNGITEMERFVPVKEIKTNIPTVTMLSHVWYAKDIKTALLAADIIINEWGFNDYRLDIYGALDKSPSYTTNCQEIIATKSLRHQVTLQGEADPIHVLERTWVFLNSSISEGLPLALGEAALTGAPIVCTDVGASLRVLTDPDDKSCYSAVVAPNDARSMARAQIKLLALLDEWAQYADERVGSDDASFPENPTPEDVARITQRMYDQTDARRRLGMKAREIVQKSFCGDRYLREHEQMLWVGKARKDMARHNSSRPTTILPIPRPVHLTEITAAPVQEAPTLPGEDSLPSLAFGNSSVMPSSIRTSLIASTVGRLTTAEQEWVKRPQPVMVKVVNMGLRRDSRTVNAMSANEIMV